MKTVTLSYEDLVNDNALIAIRIIGVNKKSREHTPLGLLRKDRNYCIP